MKKWYVIQVYAGYEEQIAADLKKQIELELLQSLFGEVLIPSAKVKALFAGQEEDQRLFPGYVLVEMELTPEAMRLVKSIPRVSKFLGGKEPVAISRKELDRIMATVKGERPVVAIEKKEFIEGAEVDIVSGPFAGFVGIIDKVDQAAERLTVMVSIFGRLTPVELGFDQVKR